MLRTIALALGLSATAAADDFEKARLDNWHQWRGPLGDGRAPKGEPPVEWSETKNIRWKAPIPGSGSATPIVWGEKIFVLTAVDTGRKPAMEPKVAAPPDERTRGMSTPAPRTIHAFDVLCLDRATGKEVWRRTAVEETPHAGHHKTHGFASASPTTDGRRLIASFGSRGIFAFDLEGKPLWKADLGDMRIKVGFGEGSSPVLHAGSVVVNWDHEGDSFIVCLDAATGREKWRRPREERTTWVTPFLVEHAGTTQVVVSGTQRIRSYDLADGKLLWECGGMTENVIPMPVARDGIVYCASGYKGYAVQAIRLDSKGDVTGGSQVVWKRTDVGPYVASPLLYDDLLYLTRERQGFLSCVDAKTGDLRFGPERLAGVDMIYASLTGAAGKVYAVSREGKTFVLKHGPKFELLSTNVLPEEINASPAIAGKRLYLRGDKHLYCIGEDRP